MNNELTVNKLINILSQLENSEEAKIRICNFGGDLSDIQNIEWDPVNECYVIYCIGTVDDNQIL